MPDILVRGVDAGAVKRLKAQAKQHGRSLQGEARVLLEGAVAQDRTEVARILEKWKKKFAGRHFEDSAKLIREDRER